jgi:enoyl-CoA hydratase/carnithine racemase
MSNYETLVYEESGDRVQLTLHRPPGNRINVQMIQELTKVCDALEDHSKARTVVIRGAGGVFSEGVDFSEFHPDKPMDIHGFNKWEKICTRLERLPKATIALVDGAAVGGGFQLALVCDLRIATSRASFQLPEVHMGFLPGMATFRMAKYVGLGHAKRMMVTCEKVGPQSALDLGIIDRVEDDLDAGLAWAIEALGPNHTVAIELTRRLLNECYAATAENAIGHFLAAQHRAITQTAFLETVRREQDKG